MKYKVGDKVRVKKDLVCDKRYGGYLFTKNMSKICGKTVKIKKVGCNFYYLEGYSDYHWTDEMLEEVDEMGNVKIKIANVKIKIAVDGNKVIAKMGKETGIARCSPEDEFDIFVGAKLALERLEEKCRPYAWLKDGVRYYYPSVSSKTLVGSNFYIGDTFDERIKERGLAFKTEEEAIEAAKKMLAVLKETDSNDSEGFKTSSGV